MNYDLHSVGFSTAGSILVLRMSPPTKDRDEGLSLQTVSSRDFLRRSLLRGDQPVEYEHVAGPASLVLKPKTGSGKVEFVFESPAILRVRTTGVALHLEMAPDTWAQAPSCIRHAKCQDSGWPAPPQLSAIRIAEHGSRWRGRPS